ncbi:SET domain containing protein, putative [Eimeria tenella]|uniref:SET domain containing protein, putative n=1 Tax=Eimeria tenella TaxID=5802 RepID=U6KNZ9_EIMTE|nr:SET domain containing protein, putative [Eimeria tenella]CDJ39837.1 SET domain containing protein, putative [Eimeria tenella]|eukprot:XP_013230590.1 SET domain containing protein, putative [Eimeria tenella]
MEAADPLSLPGTTTRVVEVYSDLPRPFALTVPPFIPLSGGGFTIASLASVVAAAYQVYNELLPQWGRSSSSSSSGNDPECSVADALALARSSISGSGSGSGSIPAWAACGFLPVVLRVESYELELTPVSAAERQRLVDTYLKEAAAAAAAAAGSEAAAATGQRWGGAGWEGGGCRLRSSDSEQQEGGTSEASSSSSSSGSNSSSSSNGSRQAKCLGPQENLERLLEKIEAAQRSSSNSNNSSSSSNGSSSSSSSGHRTLMWRKKEARLIVSKAHALQFAHLYLPQSSSCGIVSSLELGAPLPCCWSPWEDISQGRERFCIKAINEVDSEPPPTDFCELPRYCDALRDPVSGRIYCGGANAAFVKTFRPIASCSPHCLCDPALCTNRLPEDLQFRVAVAKTRHAGWELRTLEFIPRGAFIMQYVGEVLPRAAMDGRSRQASRRGFHNYCMEAVGEERDLNYDAAAPCIDALFIGNASRFLNHSCNPNVRVATIWRGPALPQVGVFAQKDIPAGCALTYAYGPGYEEMLCLCGAPNCEGFIGGGSADPSRGSADPSSEKGPTVCAVSVGLRAAALSSQKLRGQEAAA